MRVFSDNDNTVELVSSVGKYAMVDFPCIARKIFFLYIRVNLHARENLLSFPA